MPQTIRFHLDENVPRAIAAGLRHQGIDVTTTPEAGLLGAIDEEQVAYVSTCGRGIFTQDRDFLRIHASGTSHPGIAYCEKDTRTIGQILRGLIDIWEILDPEDMADHVEYIGMVPIRGHPPADRSVSNRKEPTSRPGPWATRGGRRGQARGAAAKVTSEDEAIPTMFGEGVVAAMMSLDPWTGPFRPGPALIKAHRSRQGS